DHGRTTAVRPARSTRIERPRRDVCQVPHRGTPGTTSRVGLALRDNTLRSTSEPTRRTAGHRESERRLSRTPSGHGENTRTWRADASADQHPRITDERGQ